MVVLGDCAHSISITSTMETLLRVAEELRGLDRAHVRFTGLLPISPAAEQQLLTTASYIRRGIYSLDLNTPLLIAAAEHVVAASVLTTFPNTTMTIEVRTPRDPASAATVRRAIAFIDGHASLPITLTDVATAAGVVPRTLQYAFRRHRDTTPLEYLRRVRLAQAHEELLAAEPGDGTTIAAVAARWGYRPQRFAAAYRRRYGQPPSETLRN
jgi:AraC-like DNA-binding protein